MTRLHPRCFLSDPFARPRVSVRKPPPPLHHPGSLLVFVSSPGAGCSPSLCRTRKRAPAVQMKTEVWKVVISDNPLPLHTCTRLHFRRRCVNRGNEHSEVIARITYVTGSSACLPRSHCVRYH